jgi:hypothetical protein
MLDAAPVRLSGPEEQRRKRDAEQGGPDGPAEGDRRKQEGEGTEIRSGQISYEQDGLDDMREGDRRRSDRRNADPDVCADSLAATLAQTEPSELAPQSHASVQRLQSAKTKMSAGQLPDLLPYAMQAAL